jgi:hypothetical protein
MSEHHEINKWIRSIGLLVTLILAATTCLSADKPVVKRVNALGTAVIRQKNLAEGKQNAVDDALAAAVGQVIMEMLTGETVVQRFQVINENILNRRDAYIQNYRVLTESRSGSTIRTLVQVDVAVDRVSRDLSRLGVALSGAVYPRILFMIAEKNVDDDDFTYWWGEKRLNKRTACEAAMAATLRSDGFEIVDIPKPSEPLGLAVNMSEEDMLALAKRLRAEVLVVGSGTAAVAPNTLKETTKSYEAAVDVQAINVHNGQRLGRARQKAAASGQDVRMGGSKALTSAGALAGNDLARQIMAAWQQDQGQGNLIDVVVEGTGGQIASFVRLRTAISSLSGVKELKMKEMSADRAALAVSYQGTARSLADALLLKNFTGFGIDIYEVSADTVRIRLVNR